MIAGERRPEGQYWVKLDDSNWEIAMWQQRTPDSGCWLFCGSEEEWPTPSEAEIGPRLIHDCNVV